MVPSANPEVGILQMPVDVDPDQIQPDGNLISSAPEVEIVPSPIPDISDGYVMVLEQLQLGARSPLVRPRREVDDTIALETAATDFKWTEYPKMLHGHHTFKQVGQDGSFPSALASNFWYSEELVGFMDRLLDRRTEGIRKQLAVWLELPREPSFQLDSNPQKIFRLMDDVVVHLGDGCDLCHFTDPPTPGNLGLATRFVDRRIMISRIFRLPLLKAQMATSSFSQRRLKTLQSLLDLMCANHITRATRLSESVHTTLVVSWSLIESPNDMATYFFPNMERSGLRLESTGLVKWWPMSARSVPTHTTHRRGVCVREFPDYSFDII